MTRSIPAGPAGYTEYEPAPPLARHVLRYWSLRAPQDQPQRSLPLGWPELILVTRGAVVLPHPRRRLRRAPFAVLCGPMLHSVSVETAGCVELFGVCFAPTGVSAVFGPSAAPPAGQLVLASAGPASIARLASELASVSGHARRARLADRHLTALLRQRAPLPDDLQVALRAYEELRDAGGELSVASLARRLGVSISKLERAARLHVGLSPKRQALTVRFLQVMARVPGARHVDALMAADGYFDQPQLTRDFSRRLGVSPARYLRASRTAMERAILEVVLGGTPHR